MAVTAEKGELMEDWELRDRLARIEHQLGLEPYASATQHKLFSLGDEKKSSSSGRTAMEKKEEAPASERDRISVLLARISELKQQSDEEAFDRYLSGLEEKLCRERMKIEDYADNLEKNYAVYMQRVAKRSGMDAVGNETAHSTAAAGQPASYSAAVAGQPAAHGIETVGQPAAHSMEAVGHPSEDRAEAVDKKLSFAEDVHPQMPEHADTALGEHNLRGVKPDVEFGFGVVVLSVIGSLFIIAALVTFGLNYMDNLQQGIFLYVLAGVVLLFSECVLRRHLERFAQAVSGIGLCVLYTATILNYLYLHTIGSVAAIAITLGVSLFALLLSRKRDSAALRMIGILGCYISFMPLDRFKDNTDFIITAIMLLIVNILYIFLPLKRNENAVRIVHVLANTAACFYLTMAAYFSSLPALGVFLFLAAMLLTLYAVFYRTDLGKAMLYTFCGAQIIMHLLLFFVVCDESFYIWAGVVLAALHIVAFFAFRYRKGRWMGLFCLTGYLLLTCGFESAGALLVCAAIVFLFYKVAARRWPQLEKADLVVSVVSALIFLVLADDESMMKYLLLAAFVLSVVLLKSYMTFHEIILLAVLEGFALLCFEQVIALPLAFVFLLLCLVLFTRLDDYKGKGNAVLIGTVHVFHGMLLLATLFLDNALSLTIVLVVSAAIWFFVFSKQTGIAKEKVAKYRTHAIVLLITYMLFVYDIPIPIVLSILLMVLAIASVAVGFCLRLKSVRVYGLVLSFFVYAKILLVDFGGTQTDDKVILFFVVGILALAISYLYMRIEKSLAEKQVGNQMEKQVENQDRQENL